MDLPQSLHLSSGEQIKVKMFEMDTTLNRRRPYSIYIEDLVHLFSIHLCILSTSLVLTKNVSTFPRTRCQEGTEVLILIEVEHLRIHQLDLPQIFNLSYLKCSVVDATLVGITLPWPGQRYRKHIDSCYDHAQA